MFLHALSRRLSSGWQVRVESEEYGRLVRECFNNQCPYCLDTLARGDLVIEHLDGMNRFRAGLHVPGNVLIACRRRNSEKRRDDSKQRLSLARFGWASFLSHNGAICAKPCRTCDYWKGVWPDEAERVARMSENLQRIQNFRDRFSEFAQILPDLERTLPGLLTKLYSDCQEFAEVEMRSLQERFESILSARVGGPSEDV